jgi:threonine/homoserine/homoserine lactone efflux protein
MYEVLVAAFVFGLTAGFQPGPLSVVVVQQTLEQGLRHGIRASLAPVITDGPIILAALIALMLARDISLLVAVLSLVGGCYLLWISVRTYRIRQGAMDVSENPALSGSLATAIKVNLLNPNPYLFWFTVGGTYILLGTRAQAVLFVMVCITTLVLAKMAVAVMAARFRNYLEGEIYVQVMRLLAVLLFGFALVILVRGVGVLIWMWCGFNFSSF